MTTNALPSGTQESKIKTHKTYRHVGNLSGGRDPGKDAIREISETTVRTVASVAGLAAKTAVAIEAPESFPVFNELIDTVSEVSIPTVAQVIDQSITASSEASDKSCNPARTSFG